MTETRTAPARTGFVIGYARVSTRRQNLDRQLDALTEMGATKLYADKITGRTMDRPEWKRCKEDLRPGDVLVVDNLDRLGRTALEVIATVKELADEGVVIRSKAQGELDPSTATGRLMIGMFSMLAEFEVDLKAERAAAAREAAAARGKHTGRPRKLDAAKIAEARKLWEQGFTATRIGEMLKCSRATVYRYLSEA